MKRLVLAVAFLLSGFVPAFGDRLTRDRVPEPLEPWADWVLHGQEQELCPFFHDAGHRQCVWPSRLVLTLEDETGSFSQSWIVFDRAWVPLPGDERRWPQDVTVDGKPAAVTLHGGGPSVLLEPGEHTVAGAFAWESLPEILPVPPSTGIVTLNLRGREVAFPNREPQGQLWLAKRTEAAEEARLDLVVHRMVTDEIPLLLRTRIELRVSGKSREVILGRALPEGFVPMSLDGPLPARLEPDGRLRAQIRPGTWVLDILARAEAAATPLTLPEPDGQWDPEEVWVFDARPSLRLVTVEGVSPVDPQQTELPGEWRHLPAYLMAAGSSMKLDEKRRGDSDPAPDQLSLRRTWWLDFDGGGFTMRDSVTGTMRRNWRLEMAAPIELGRVSVNGREQFITRLGGAGVEIRQSNLSVEADSRLAERSPEIPAVGWKQDFQSVSSELRLPPGWRLFHASGVDDVSSSWIADWTLLDLFLVLVTAIAVWRLFGWSWGTIALVALALTYREPGAPGVIWLFALAGVALVAALSEGRLRRVAELYHLATVVALALVLVPYMIGELRRGLWPALERPWEQSFDQVQTVSVEAPPPPPMPQAAPAESLMVEEQRQMADQAGDMERDAFRSKGGAQYYGGRGMAGGIAAGMSARKEARQGDIDPNAKITTGPGLPRWSWTSVALNWRGPVGRDQTLRMTLLSPGVNLALALLRVALAAALLFVVSRSLRGSLPRFGMLPAGTAAAILALFSSFTDGSTARADFPSAEMLEELRTRLLENPECFPSCASMPRLRVEATAAELSLRIEIDAAADTAVPLPGGTRGWVPKTIAVDGRPSAALERDPEGVLWIAVPAGRHQIVLAGPLPSADSVEIPLPMRPRRVEASVTGWTLSGVDEDGVVSANLQLARTDRTTAAADGETLAPTPLPPFLRIERTVRLGLSLEVDTTIARLTPPGASVIVEVPLLEGESVTTPDVRVVAGKALVSLGPQATHAGWHSILTDLDSITLRASEAVPWTEVWRLDAGTIWHVDIEGIPTIHEPQASDPRIREWHPWPGEVVKIAVTRPEGMPGRTLTIDRSELAVTPGLRASDSKLTLEIRSSRGGQHPITLPEGAELLSVTVNGNTQPIRAEGRTVTLPIIPGSQLVLLEWREPRGIARSFSTPEVAVGADSVNAELRVLMPQDRWTLLLSRSRLGPAVLFWPVVAVLAGVAFALGRARFTPLRARHWFLLSLGLTQVEITTGAIVIGWLLALGLRKEHGAGVTGNRFNWMQLGLVVWTLVALAGLVASIEQGLLGLPEMQITGNGSTAYDLRWYHDRSAERLPREWIVSAPLWVYRVAMLAWALWLALALIGWVRWGWDALNEGGLWRSSPFSWRRKAKGAPPGPSPAAAAPSIPSPD